MGFFKDLFGPREPCALCHLGESSWPSDRSGVADWKVRGHGLRATFLICGRCRRVLLENGLDRKSPMLALAVLVATRQAERPSLHAYLQHPEWRKYWMHVLDTGGLSPSDEFEALRMMEPLEEEFLKRGRQLVYGSSGSEPQGSSDLKLDRGLRKMMDEYGIPMEVVQRKYMSYAVVLGASNQQSNWNADIDDHARNIGALTESEIEDAKTDLHKAILNRIKVAFVSEGWIRFFDEDDA